jgi:hypothetical protein
MERHLEKGGGKGRLRERGEVAKNEDREEREMYRLQEGKTD